MNSSRSLPLILVFLLLVWGRTSYSAPLEGDDNGDGGNGDQGGDSDMDECPSGGNELVDTRCIGPDGLASGVERNYNMMVCRCNRKSTCHARGNSEEGTGTVTSYTYTCIPNGIVKQILEDLSHFQEGLHLDED